MRTLHPLIVLILSAVTVQGLAQQNAPADLPVFVDAEHRILHNKNNGLPKYEGVTVQYAFLVTTDSGWNSVEELFVAVGSHFTGLLSTKFEREGPHLLLLLLTDGHLSNHAAYDHVLQQYGSTLARHPRSYFLKQP